MWIYIFNGCGNACKVKRRLIIPRVMKKYTKNGWKKGKSKRPAMMPTFWVEIVGVEPMTYRLRTCRSTNWAISPLGEPNIRNSPRSVKRKTFLCFTYSKHFFRRLVCNFQPKKANFGIFLEKGGRVEPFYVIFVADFSCFYILMELFLRFSM